MKALALLGLCAASGCGGNKGTLTVNLVLPVGDDPFAQAAKVHVWAGDPAIAEATANVSSGHFSASLQFTPSSSTVAGAVHVEALAADGTVVARGQSPVLALRPQDEAISVFVGPVGRVVVAPARLTRARTAIAAAPIPHLGPAFIGGVDANGTPVTDVDVYQLYSVQMMVGASLPAVRRDAVALGFDRQGEAAGAVLLVGGSGSQELSFFDPLAGSSIGQWSATATTPILARDRPSVGLLPDGTMLVSGGLDPKDGTTRLNTALLLQPSGNQQPTATSEPMKAPRVGHTITAAQLSGGAGAILFGGAEPGQSAAETYLAAERRFTAIDDPSGQPSRTGHAAIARSNGQVLIIGGTDPSGQALDTMLSIDPRTLAITVVAQKLSAARFGHTATRAGSDILVCGGTDGNGMPIPNCEVFDEKSLTPRDLVTLATPRTGHVALALETGVVVLAGGTGQDHLPIAQIEIYTW